MKGLKDLDVKYVLDTFSQQDIKAGMAANCDNCQYPDLKIIGTTLTVVVVIVTPPPK